MQLTEFLLHTLSEDERAACAAVADDQRGFRPDALSAAWDGYLRGAGGPEHLLAACEATRRIVAEHRLGDPLESGRPGCVRCDWDGTSRSWRNTGPCETLRLLALPYAGRVGYELEWQPRSLALA